MLIQHLTGAGEKKLAHQLLEEHLSGFSRNSQALAMLAQLCAEDNDYDKAITLGNEAWERKSHGRQTGNSYYYGGYYPVYYSGYGRVDNLLRELHGYYVARGKARNCSTGSRNNSKSSPAPCRRTKTWRSCIGSAISATRHWRF